MYQNPVGIAAAQKLNGKERAKRIKMMQEFKDAFGVAVTAYDVAIKGKPRVDLEEQPLVTKHHAQPTMSAFALKAQ